VTEPPVAAEAGLRPAKGQPAPAGDQAVRDLGSRTPEDRDPHAKGQLASRSVQTLPRTPLYERHVAAGARLVPFAGWEMPVQYTGVIPAHLAVRADAGAFDVSHMGQLHVEGPMASEFLQAMLSNDLDRLSDGEA